MRIKKIQIQNNDVYITCPTCETCEGLGVDEPRHRFNHLPIIDWIEGLTSNNKELSINKCGDCETEFITEWNYEQTQISSKKKPC